MCALRHQELVTGLVDGEGAADRDGGAAGGGERFEGGIHVVLVEAAGHVDEGVLGLERVSGGECDRADARSLARGAKVGLRADPEDSDAADVPLEQGVHGLCRRKRDERDTAAVLTELREEVAQSVDDAVRRALRLVRGRNDSVSKQPERPGLDRDGLRERPADVDADPDRAAHARTACAARRRHGRIPKTQAVPRM